jgi:hypothetical protein
LLAPPAHQKSGALFLLFFICSPRRFSEDYSSSTYITLILLAKNKDSGGAFLLLLALAEQL